MVRILYADLSCLCSDDGFIPGSEADLASAIGMALDEFRKAVKELHLLGFLDMADGAPQLRAVARDTRYRKSRVKGGKARQRAAKAGHAEHHAQHSCSASSSLISSDLPDLIPESLRTPEFRKAWADWTSYRRERHLAVWKPATIRKNAAEWVQWGPERAVAAIDASIRSGWQGVFEPKGPVGPQAARPDGLAGLRQRLAQDARTVTVERQEAVL